MPNSRFSLRPVLSRWVLLALALGLSACQRSAPPAWALHDISGHMPDLAFALTDDQGKPVTAETYRGKVVVLYFGYTHCPDVCPLTLAHLHVDLQQVGPLADQVRVLFVSVDPARDTPQQLHDYVRAFDSHVVGLTGDPATIEALSKRYRAAYTRDPSGPDGNYEVAHSSGIYLFDRAGHAQLLATPSDPQDGIVHDLKLLLQPDRS